MAEIKIVINDPKTGKSYQRALDESQAGALIGKKINDTVKGDAFGLDGYEFKITGGSDSAGFPMRWDVDMTRKRILAVEGVGLTKKDPGSKQRKTVAGNQVTGKTSQVNLKITKAGKASLGEPKAEEKPSEDATSEKAPEDKPKEKKPEEDKKEEKPAEDKKDTPEKDEKPTEQTPAEKKEEKVPADKKD